MTRFNVLTDPIPGMTCGKCGGEVYINGKWTGRQWFVICLRCRIVTLETEADPEALDATRGGAE